LIKSNPASRFKAKIVMATACPAWISHEQEVYGKYGPLANSPEYVVKVWVPRHGGEAIFAEWLSGGLVETKIPGEETAMTGAAVSGYPKVGRPVKGRS
jgi:hypothetical protein